MHPGDDPALAARFLGWLQARHAADAGLAHDVARLSEMEGWALPAGALAERISDIGEKARLMRLHGLWTTFRLEVPADWVEIAGRRADDVAWVDPAADLARPAPPGPAPVLLRGELPAGRRRGRRRPVAGALIATAAALAVLLPLAHSLRAARRQRADILDTQQAVAGTPRSLLAMRERLSAQERTASRLVKARASQRAAVNASCEGAEDCVRRLAALDASARLAQAVLAAGREDAAHPSLPPPARPVAANPPAVLLSERQDLASIAAPTPSQAAELAALEVALRTWSAAP